MASVPTTPATVRARDGLVARVVGDDTVILDLESGEYYSLNGVGSFIWARIGEGKPLDDITAAMVDHYEVESAEAHEDLTQFIAELMAMGLIEA